MNALAPRSGILIDCVGSNLQVCGDKVGCFPIALCEDFEPARQQNDDAHAQCPPGRIHYSDQSALNKGVNINRVKERTGPGIVPRKSLLWNMLLPHG